MHDIPQDGDGVDRRGAVVWIHQSEAAAPQDQAAPPPPPAAELPALAETLPKQIVPKTPADVADAKSNLNRAVKTLGQFLDDSGTQGVGWKKFLKWDQLEAALAAQEPDLARLKGVLDRFEADVDGLEMQPYTAVRDALRKFLYVSLMARNPGVLSAQLEKYDRLFPQLPKFDALLRAYGPSATHIDSVAIAARLGELEKFGEAPRFVGAVRHYYSHPNLAATWDAELSPRESKTISTRWSISGRRFSAPTSSARAICKPTSSWNWFRPAAGRAAPMFQGQTQNKTIGYHDPVEIYSTGVTQLSGAKQIHITRDGLGDVPATAEATTSTHVDDIATDRGGIVQRKAWERVGDSKAEAEKIAGTRAAARMRQRMDKQAAELLAKANHDYAYKFHDPLVRCDAFPSILDFSTTESVLRVLMQQAAADQLAARRFPRAAAREPRHGRLFARIAAEQSGGDESRRADDHRQVVGSRGRRERTVEKIAG